MIHFLVSIPLISLFIRGLLNLLVVGLLIGIIKYFHEKLDYLGDYSDNYKIYRVIYKFYVWFSVIGFIVFIGWISK